MVRPALSLVITLALLLQLGFASAYVAAPEPVNEPANCVEMLQDTMEESSCCELDCSNSSCPLPCAQSASALPIVVTYDKGGDGGEVFNTSLSSEAHPPFGDPLIRPPATS